MIRFSLRCDKAHEFEGWFRSSSDFDAQIQRNLLACPVCGSTSVQKALMAPAVTGTKKSTDGLEPNMGPAPPVTPEADHAAGPNDASAKAASNSRALPVPQAAHLPPALQAHPQMQEVLNAMRELRRRVTAEADYVGGGFAEEARKMHFGEADLRAIYGEATIDEAKELIEEGIDVAPLPILPEDRN